MSKTTVSNPKAVISHEVVQKEVIDMKKAKMAKSKSVLPKRSAKKSIRMLELAVVLVAVSNIVAPGLLPIKISTAQALLLLAFLGVARGAKPTQGLLKKTFLASLAS